MPSTAHRVAKDTKKGSNHWTDPKSPTLFLDTREYPPTHKPKPQSALEISSNQWFFATSADKKIKLLPVTLQVGMAKNPSKHIHACPIAGMRISGSPCTTRSYPYSTDQSYEKLDWISCMCSLLLDSPEFGVKVFD